MSFPLPDDTFEALLFQAYDLYSQGELDASARLLRSLTVARPREPRPWKLLGSIHMLEGRSREAQVAFGNAHELDPDDPYVLAALGELRLDINRVSEALALFERLFALDPEGKHPAANRGRALLEHTYQKLKQL